MMMFRTIGCNTLAEQGSCDFYKCADSAVPCGNEGYALGYGYRYCLGFTALYNEFTDEVSMSQYVKVVTAYQH